ncbi:unnamed protein product [Musa textilis]
MPKIPDSSRSTTGVSRIERSGDKRRELKRRDMDSLVLMQQIGEDWREAERIKNIPILSRSSFCCPLKLERRKPSLFFSLVCSYVI